MPTRILLKTRFPKTSTVNREIMPFTEVYCKESPFETLQLLGPKANVGSYKSLTTNNELFAQSEKGFFYTLALQEGIPGTGMSIDANLKDFDLTWIGTKDLKDQHERNLDSFIEQHLIEQENTSTYFAIAKGRPRMFGGELKDIKTYFDGPKERLKEATLKEIIEYGQAIIPDIDREEIKKRCEEIAYNSIH